MKDRKILPPKPPRPKPTQIHRVKKAYDRKREKNTIREEIQESLKEWEEQKGGTP